MSTLQNLNTRNVGYFGLAAGGASVLATIAALFKLLSDPKYLVALYHALVDAHHHATTADNQFALAQLVAACVAIFGGFVIAILASYLGKPQRLLPRRQLKKFPPIQAVSVPAACPAPTSGDSMNTNQIIQILLGLLQAFFGSNPIVEDVEVVLPQILTAIANAKAGVAFSVSAPLSVDGKKGTFEFSWTPA
jgi:hypothetical protein